MQRVFELISSVNNIVNNMKATAKKVCRNIIITMAMVISILTVIIVSMIINGEQNSYADESTEIAGKEINAIEAADEDVMVAKEDVIKATTETVTENITENVTEATTEMVTEVVTETATQDTITATEATTAVVEEQIEEQTSVYLTSAEVEAKEYVTSTYAPVEIYYTQTDYDALLRIVHAEAGNQDDIGKILVANVIINRVKSDIYPDDIYSVITQNDGRTYQFSPVIPGGSFYSVTPTEHTRQCVDRALAGEDYSQGALYFCMETSQYSWFNTNLTFLFAYGPHYFYR